MILAAPPGRYGPEITYHGYPDNEADPSMDSDRTIRPETLQEFYYSLSPTNMHERVVDRVVHTIVNPHGR